MAEAEVRAGGEAARERAKRKEGRQREIGKVLSAKRQQRVAEERRWADSADEAAVRKEGEGVWWR